MLWIYFVVCLCLFNINLTKQADSPVRSFDEGIAHISAMLTYLKNFDKQINQRPAKFNLDQSSIHNESQCMAELQTLASNLLNQQTWALKTFDAWGKIPSGVMEGNVFWIGSTHECNHALHLLNGSAVQSPFRTHSCLINNASPGEIRPIYGICVPKSCTADQIIDLINRKQIDIPTVDAGFLLKNGSVYCVDRREYNRSAIFTIVLLSFISSVILLATSIHLVQHHRRAAKKKPISSTDQDPIVSRTVTTGSSAIMNADDETPITSSLNHGATDQDDDVELINTEQPKNIRSASKAFLYYCSLINNYSIVSHNQRPKMLACLNGIRVLSLFWVILGHTVMYGISFSDNVIQLLSWTRQLWFQLIIQAVFSIDSFFLLSGLLTAFIFFIMKNENEHFSLGKFLFNHYVYRYLRYTLFYGVVLLIYINLSPYLSPEGPVYPIHGSETEACHQNWWHNLLYINNFFKSANSCMPVTWFLAVNMQFHWIAPLFLLAVLWKWLAGLLVIVAFILVDIISTAVIVSKNNYDASPLFSSDSNSTQGYMDNVYVKPWCRIAPYAIGLALGYCLYENYQRKNSISWESLLPEPVPNRSQRIKQIVIWSFALTIIGLCIFGTFRDYDGHSLTKAGRAAFLSLSRVGWAVAISLIITSCCSGEGGLANQFLSHRLFDYLGELTYGAYLWHSLVIIVNYFGRDIPIHYTLPNLIFNCFIHIILSYGLSFLTFLFIELPIIQILKVLFKRTANEN